MGMYEKETIFESSRPFLQGQSYSVAEVHAKNKMQLCVLQQTQLSQVQTMEQRIMLSLPKTPSPLHYFFLVILAVIFTRFCSLLPLLPISTLYGDICLSLFLVLLFYALPCFSSCCLCHLSDCRANMDFEECHSKSFSLPTSQVAVIKSNSHTMGLSCNKQNTCSTCC